LSAKWKALLVWTCHIGHPAWGNSDVAKPSRVAVLFALIDMIITGLIFSCLLFVETDIIIIMTARVAFAVMVQSSNCRNYDYRKQEDIFHSIYYNYY
jgi:hypothetical protein